MRALLTRYFQEWGPIPLRLALGTIIMAHGWAGLNRPPGAPGNFDSEWWGWLYPTLWAWVVVLVQTFGGLLIVVGLLTRIAAVLVALVIAVAIFRTRLALGFVGGFEFHVALLSIAVSLIVTGAGRLSVDRDVLGWGAPPPRSRVGETPYD
jgi:putative oxidoreductase